MASRAETERVRKKKPRDRDGSESRQFLTPSRFLLPGRAPAALCPMCALQLPLMKSPSLRIVFQARRAHGRHHPPFWNPSTAATGGKWMDDGRCVRQENLLSVCFPVHSIHSFHAVSPQLRFRHSPTTHHLASKQFSLPMSPTSRYHDCETRPDRSVPGPQS